MTRDWTIIRAVLLRLEAAETANTVLNSHAFEEFAEQHVAYNMRLLAERGYIEANIAESKTGDGHISVALARRLTTSGHDLLDTMRSDTVWKKVQERFKSKGIDMTFDLVIQIGKQVMQSVLSS